MLLTYGEGSTFKHRDFNQNGIDSTKSAVEIQCDRQQYLMVLLFKKPNSITEEDTWGRYGDSYLYEWMHVVIRLDNRLP